MQVSERRDDLAGRAACITFATPPLLAAFQRELRLEIPLFGDPERVTYEAFGFGRGSIRRVWLDPRVWASYARLLARGRRMHRAREDTLQLGGDAVLDAGLRLRWIHHSRGPEDRPAVDELIAALAEAARG
ncbi:MAG: hypothetical protein QOK04_1781 [Solirubrobacteraceae bacterium]|nr:hypothetical protein [Solirubrobacteraceae bacterium]